MLGSVELSEQVLEHAYRKLQFVRTPLSASDGNLSIAVALGYTEGPSTPHTVFVARSDVFRTEVQGIVSPEGFRFLISRPECALAEIVLPCPGPCDGLDLHIYALNYSSRLRRYKWLTPHSSGLPTDLDLGWLEPSAFSVTVLGKTFGDIAFRMTSLFSALLSHDDIRGMCTAPRGTFGLLEDSKVAAARSGFP